jgi:DNA-directed RNA polymerase I subunit RPA1
MSVPLRSQVTDNEAVKLTRSFAKLTLNELIAGRQGVTVRETLAQSDSGLWQRAYYVTLNFHPAERIKTAFGLTLKEIAKVVAKSFVPALSFQMKLELRRSATEGDAIVSVEGGEASDYVHETLKEDEGAHSNVNDLDEKDILEDDDDDTVDAAGAEDGVVASRAQAESYGGKDDDERSVSSDQSSSIGDEEKKDDAGDDGTKTTSVSFDLPASIPFVGDSTIKLDYNQNAIHLQPLRVDPSARPLLMVGLVEKAAAKTLVRSRKDLDEAFVNDEEGRGRCLQTAGINFSELWKLDNVDHDLLRSNDIWAVRCAYGVEAARSTIVDQIRSVFGVYGIEVDPRHLSLIADYMTFGGGYTAMNRNGMKEMSSPFLQMSFETTAQFLTQAALTSSCDELKSPSANIVVGRPIRHGTGSFSLLVK